MKGGKDDEKTMGPMFPRLHVNDTEKGGPRAPPRNKMALYEQLSVPSQRFNSGSQQVNNSNNLVPSTTSFSQGAGQERTVFSPFQIPPSGPVQSADNSNSRSTEGLDLRTKAQSSELKPMKTGNYQNSNSLMHFPPIAERGSFHPPGVTNSKNFCVSKLGNEDDFRVPTFVNSQKDLCLNKDQPNMDRDNISSLSPSRLDHSTAPRVSLPKVAHSTCSSSTHHQNAHDKHLKRTNTTNLRSRHSRDNSEDNHLQFAINKECEGMSTSHPLTRDNISGHLKHAYASPIQEQSTPIDDLGGLGDMNAHLRQGCRTEIVLEDTTHSDGEPVRPMEKGNDVWVRNESRSRASPGNGHGSSSDSSEDTTHRLQAEDADQNDDASETSMVDSITVLDISPDDVVGAIGQKHFWKARRAIVNQQRLFAVQVFELHRLIKVQRLIAGSPHLLLDDTPYITKPSPKVSSLEKLSSDYGLKSSQQIIKQKTESQKPNQSTDCAAEHAVWKLPSVSDSVNRGQINHHSGYGISTGNPPTPPPTAPAPAPAPAPVPTPTPIASDNKAGWFFHPPPGNQWLVPVMSPSEGLVYKPYTGPCSPASGFMAPIYGGCGPMNMTPLHSDFPGTGYGIRPHPQGISVLPGAPPLAQSYFSPYGMPVMNPLISSSAVEQVNRLGGSQSHGQAVQLLAGEANFNMQSWNSCNMSNQKSEAMSHFNKFQASKEIERQGSTASSPSERPQGVAGNVPDGRDALSLFPMGPAAQAPPQTQQTHSSEQQRTRVIKVVPHNPRSATESAARIFQSIQEERQNYD